MLKLLLLWILLLTTTLVLAQNQEVTQALIQQLEKNHKDSNSVRLLNKISASYYSSHPDLSLEYARKALALAQQLNMLSDAADALYNIGVYYVNRGNLTAALEYHSRALRIRESVKDSLQMACSLNSLGEIFRLQNDYVRALEHYLKALGMKQLGKDSHGIAKSLNNIGLLYLNQKDFYNALLYHKKALRIRDSIHDEAGRGVSLRNIGDVYRQQKNYPLALEYYFKAQAIDRVLEDWRAVAKNLEQMATIYGQMGNYPAAIQSYQEIIHLEPMPVQQLILAYKGIGQAYSAMGEHQKAMEAGLKSFEMARRQGEISLIEAACQNLHKIYACAGKYEKAFYYQKEYGRIRDSLYSRENNRRIANLKYYFELDKRDAQIELLRKNNELREQELYRKNLQLYGSVFIVILIIINTSDIF